jgi:hypothetical protein
MGPSNRLRAPLVFLALAASGCVPVADEAGRACPCASGGGYVCCASTNTCIPQSEVCAPVDAGSPPDGHANDEGGNGKDGGRQDASPADAGGPTCGAVPEPVARFTFDDCDARGVYRDGVGGLVGIRRGDGVHCAAGPRGAALAFDGDRDGGDAGGSYVRVMDSADAGEHACTGECRPVPAQFTSAITIAVYLRLTGMQPFAHILGQWYGSDSYMLMTEGDDAGQRMELAVQTSDADAGPITITAPVAVDTWIHWVATYGGGHARLYRDGALVADKVTPNAPLRCTDVPLELGQIGRQGACGGDIDYAYWRGAMSDLRLYDRALSAAEVTALECAITNGER